MQHSELLNKKGKKVLIGIKIKDNVILIKNANEQWDINYSDSHIDNSNKKFNFILV